MVLRWILKGWIRAALWFRFRQVDIIFHGPPPLDGGAILAGNHQNAILDSMTLATCSPKVPYILSRASLFNNRLARAFLETLHMLPIYRFRDGFGKMRKNAEVFEQFVGVLRNDGWLLMFPEGSHQLRYALRPLQKGFARIVFAAQEAEGWKRDIPIIPVGLQYESHTTFGSRLLIQYGPPLSSLVLRALHSRNPKEAERVLAGAVFDGLKRLLILLPPDEDGYAGAVQRWHPNKGRFPDLMEQFRADQEMLSAEAGSAPGPGTKKNAWPKPVGYALSLPGLVTHLPALLGILAWEKAFVRDLHLVPAARFALGLFLVPLWWVAALGLVHGQLRSWAWDLLLLVLLPFSLWLWSRCWHWTR
jgi:1-acyl-sn-glycerol-3-phosphate acyltransferase